MYCRCNPDEEIRRLERLAAQGDTDALIRLRVARYRAGEKTGFVPPEHIASVINHRGGFTIVTYGRRIGTSTLWRPGRLLSGSAEGNLVRYESGKFYQNIEPVTWAYYRVPGYNKLVVIFWN